MPFPIKSLPVLQNYSCHACGTCCTDYWVPVSDEERQRIAAQGWEGEPGFANVPLFKAYGPFWNRSYRLNQKEGDRCIFLDEKGLCKIHARFGFDAKPFACRLYPYILVPHGNHWRVSLRFACPSVAASKGKPLAEQTADLNAAGAEMEQWRSRPGSPRPDGPGLGDPPPLAGRERVGWEDLHRFTNALTGILRDDTDPLPRRMLRCLALSRFCRNARFEKLTGGRLGEFLELARAAGKADVPRDLGKIPPPTFLGRLLFRTSLALFLRKDQGARRGWRTSNPVGLRWQMFTAMTRMVRGRGKIPALQVGLPDTTFADHEEPLGPLPPEAVAALERYYLIKVEALQFCGPMFYRLPLWDGVEHLVLTLPLIQWLARGYRDLGPLEAIYKGITLVDEHFGYNPRLGHPYHKLGVRILSFREELDRLVAWYSR
jgi:lysine-N-methylase